VSALNTWLLLIAKSSNAAGEGASTQGVPERRLNMATAPLEATLPTQSGMRVCAHQRFCAAAASSWSPAMRPQLDSVG